MGVGMGVGVGVGVGVAMGVAAGVGVAVPGRGWEAGTWGALASILQSPLPHNQTSGLSAASVRNKNTIIKSSNLNFKFHLEMIRSVNFVNGIRHHCSQRATEIGFSIIVKATVIFFGTPASYILIISNQITEIKNWSVML